MKIFIHVDNTDLTEGADEVAAAIADWLPGCGCTAQLVDEQDPDSGVRTLGLRIDTGRKAVLKKALDFLHAIAKDRELDFVVGYVDADSGAAHKVCYFGHEEGRPDVGEIGSYLGLKR